MVDTRDRTAEWLTSWHGGERAGLNHLLERDLTWIHDRVQKRLGPALRGKTDSVDIVQDAMVEVLRYAPRFVVDSQARFRALMSKIVENVLRDKNDFYRARRRAMSREGSQLGPVTLDGLGAAPATNPDAAAERNEEQSRMRLALELLSPEDREVIILKVWEGLDFPAIGDRLGLKANTARMRFNRAMPKLAEKIERLSNGGDLLGGGAAED